MPLLAPPILLFVLLSAENKPAPKVPIGKETTYVTGPLDKEGYIDYSAALNDRLGKGISPEKNANVLLWKALRPTLEGGAAMPDEFFKRLGIEEPPREGAYFIRPDAFLKDHLKLPPVEVNAFYEQLTSAGKRPWTAKEHPHISGWLKINEKPLALVIEATRRPDYFNPLVYQRNERGEGSLMGALLPGVQDCRTLAFALTARGMLRVGEERFDEAWQDLLACHRLGRLLGRGGTPGEGVVGLAIDRLPTQADLAFLERNNGTSRQIQDFLNDLQNLPPMPPMADKIELGERFMYLDSVQTLRRGNLSMLGGLSVGEIPKPDARVRKNLESIDWGPALRDGNRWHDRSAAALRLKERTEREKELDQIAAEIQALKKEATGPGTFARLLLGIDPRYQLAGKAIGDVLIDLLLPASLRVQKVYDRSEQVQRNLHIAFALAAYERDHKRYPTRLDELALKYLPVVPDDLFSGKALVYRPTEKGYLLYSVGVNGKDEGGRSFDDNPAGDDLPVRMPLPVLKQKK